MYEAEIIRHFSKVPVFSLADLAQIIPNRPYAKNVISRLVKRKKVRKIKRDSYTFSDDPFLVATFLLRPSYISSVSALSYYRMITQIPKEVFCFTSKPTGRHYFIERINFHHTKFFFGFEMKRYLDYDIPIATPEKAIIDSIGKVPLSIVEDALDEVNLDRMIHYLGLVKKSSIVKRIGYLLEAHGRGVFHILGKYMDSKYIPLDPLARGRGVKDRKWKVMT